MHLIIHQKWNFNIIFVIHPFDEEKPEDSHIPLSRDASWLSIGEIPTLWAKNETTVSHPKKIIGLILLWVSTISQLTYLPIYIILPLLLFETGIILVWHAIATGKHLRCDLIVWYPARERSLLWLLSQLGCNPIIRCGSFHHCPLTYFPLYILGLFSRRPKLGDE